MKYKVKYGRIMWRDSAGLHVVSKSDGPSEIPEAVAARNRTQLALEDDEDIFGDGGNVRHGEEKNQQIEEANMDQTNIPPAQSEEVETKNMQQDMGVQTTQLNKGEGEVRRPRRQYQRRSRMQKKEE